MRYIKYYFASRKDFDGKELFPKIPKNKMKHEDNKTLRICVSQSINGCLTAIGGFRIGEFVYIHECESENVIQPTIEQVEDVCFTGEQWILEPVVMKRIMKIAIIGMLDATVHNMSNVLYGFKLVEE